MGQCLCTDPLSLPFVMQTASNAQLMQQIPDFKPPEASTEHTSPFGLRTLKNTSGFESSKLRNCEQFVHEASRTDAEHVFTIEPSIAPQRKGSISRRIKGLYSASNTQNHISKCEPREQEMQDIHPEATVD